MRNLVVKLLLQHQTHIKQLYDLIKDNC